MARPLEALLVAHKARGGSASHVPLKLVGEEGASLGECVAEKNREGDWQVKYQAIEPEDPFDTTAYGERKVKVVTPTGAVLLSGEKINITPHENILPATRYVFHDAMTNEIIPVENIQTVFKDSSEAMVNAPNGELPTGLA